MSFKKKIYLKLNKLKFTFPIKKKKGKYSVILHEKNKKFIRAIKYISTIAGLFLALITFRSVFVAFFIGLLLFIIGRFLEKIIFAYYTIFIPPFPDFDVEMDKWIGVGFGKLPSNDKKNEIPVVSWIFSDINYSRKIHSLLLEWSNGELEDRQNNVKLSVILHKNNTYTFYCYPSLERKYAKIFHRKVEKELKKEKSSSNDILQQLSLIFIIGKVFEITNTSFLPVFTKKYRDGIPYLFKLMYSDDIKSDPQVIGNLQDFVFCNLKIMNEKDLTRKDIEFDLVRLQKI